MPPPQIRLVKGYKGMLPPPEPDELETAIARFLVSKQALAADTQVHYRQALAHFRVISPEWPPTPGSIIRFVNYCQSKYQKSTTHSYWSVIRGFVLFLVKRKIITDNPLEEVSAPTRPQTLPKSPPVESVKGLIDYLEKQVERVLTGKKRYDYWGWHEIRNLALYSLFVATGLRNAEAANVRLEDIDLKAQFVFVREAKGIKQRYIPFGNKTRADLNLWLRHRKLIPMLPDSPGLDYLFISRRVGWRPMATANIENTLEKVCEEAGITPILNPHDLRHFFAYQCHHRGISLERVRLWMGHSDIATTARYVKGKEGLDEYLTVSPRDNL